MAPAPRLMPLLDQFDLARKRLADRMAGPQGDSGDGEPIAIPRITEEEFFWEPVPGCWTIRLRTSGPGPGATVLSGRGQWGRDGGRPHPWPPPFTTIAWRLDHLSEMLSLRADHTIGTHRLTRDDHVANGDVAGALVAFDTSAAAWRSALVGTDDAALDVVGRSTYPTAATPRILSSRRSGGLTKNYCTTEPRLRSCAISTGRSSGVIPGGGCDRGPNMFVASLSGRPVRSVE
jgi:hypothetical protein